MYMGALCTVRPVVILTRSQPALDGFARLAEGIEREATAAGRLVDKSTAADGLFDLRLVDGLPVSRFHDSDLMETDHSGAICYVSFGPTYRMDHCPLRPFFTLKLKLSRLSFLILLILLILFRAF